MVCRHNKCRFLYNVRYKLLFNGTIKCILYNGKIEKVKSIIIIMYTYHALIDTLSAQVIMHININNASDTLTFVIPRVNTETFGERSFFFTLTHLFGTVFLKHSATLILPPLLKPPSRRTCLIIISKLFFTTVPIPSSDT